ncbi:hypothetical protein [uncultured Duodenibacillus sp.]|jgi:hypothetical protein|uniref:hypothetical protein n=1 Tax=uncultured Duodenibacillus sp. TaxID=1980699 RepID=UPI00258BE1A8|nr:hypothetical protein [uncultured Duodenibacillus sp.]
MERLAASLTQPAPSVQPCGFAVDFQTFVHMQPLKSNEIMKNQRYRYSEVFHKTCEQPAAQK